MTYQIESLKKLAKLELGAGDRLVRVIAKKGTIGKKAIESQGCIIPTVSIGMLNTLLNDPVGKEYLQGCIASVQDALVRKAVENGKMAIFDDTIGIGAMLDAMRATNESVRFSKESIKVWFDEFMKDALATAIRNKFSNAAEDKIESMVSNYLASFQILAQRNPSMSKEVKAGLIRAMEIALPEDHDSVTGEEIATRLSAVQEASVMLEML